ncbi:SOUL family heme-binding protein [Alexandriicola marinus]|uniref:SOUL family heme-binding protein n=1 Tax=Alexandriicola marinus TaxID=2081710 RepID=UPI001EEDA108|nr:heme-binding protein [Alexandriicola marinus]
MSILSRMLAGATAALPVGASADSYGKYDSPPYTVEQRIGEIEIRQYAPHILAEVTVSGDRSGALNRGFQVLAGYIFGGNTSRAKVAMTSPVAQSERIDMTSPVGQSGRDGYWTVTFMMPSDYTMETLPTPDSPAIRLVEAGGDRQAVLIYSGRPTTSAVEAHETELREALETAGISYREPAQYYYYDAPMTPPWQRRNEVSFILD